MVDRIYVVCEGQSECAFIKENLNPWFLPRTGGKCQLIPYVVITSRDRKAGRIHRGGIVGYGKVKDDILRCMSYGQPVTTMIDLFRLSRDFPCFQNASGLDDSKDRVLFLEHKMKEDILESARGFRSDFFIPYIELHEFEALFYCDLTALRSEYVDREEQRKIDKLISDVQGLAPEEINNGSETAPSKRLQKALNYRKGDAVVSPLARIGIDRMMEKCPHFSSWVNILLEVSNC